MIDIIIANKMAIKGTKIHAPTLFRIHQDANHVYTELMLIFA